MKVRTFHYTTYHNLRDWLACGWQVAIPNAPSYHNHYGVVVEWLCGCKLVRPK